MFNVMTANSSKLRAEAYKLRYQVYCVEKGYEDAAENPGGLEIDPYDPHSVHTLLLHEPSQQFVGAARLVLPRRDRPHASFPVQSVCSDVHGHGSRRFPMASTAEVSRFCLSKERLRRISTRDAATSCLDMTIELIQGLVRISADQGITHWCAMMEPTLLRLLSRLSIYFRPLGPLVDFHGKRQPCYQQISVLLDRVEQEKPDIWLKLTANGAYAPMSPSEHAFPMRASA